MARLIDADDLLENAIDYVDWYSYHHLHGFTAGAASEDNAFMRYNDIIAAIKNAPTIDAVPVVRCKGCQYAWPEGDGYCCTNAEGMDVNVHLTGEEFCSCGKPRLAEPS